jgi:hypothetical protein
MNRSKKPFANYKVPDGPLMDDFVEHLEHQKKPLPPNAAKAVAARQLQKGGYLAGGTLTPKGKARQAMGPAARAKLRDQTR